MVVAYRKRQFSHAAQRARRVAGCRTARNLQGAQYEMDYAYNASSALHSPTRRTSRGGRPRSWEASRPPACRRPTPRPRRRRRLPQNPRACPRARPRPCPRRPGRRCHAVPDGHVPSSCEGCAPNCLCCASIPKPSTEDPTTFYNEHMEKDFNPAEPDQCLMCDHGFACVERAATARRMATAPRRRMVDYAYRGRDRPTGGSGLTAKARNQD